MEDRIVKNFFRGKLDGDDFNSQLKSVGKIIKPSLAEIQENPRARSAILRIGEKSYA
jgi:16S rRNA (cytosine1402-N4)-methyltransferase